MNHPKPPPRWYDVEDDWEPPREPEEREDWVPVYCMIAWCSLALAAIIAAKWGLGW